MAKNYIQDGKIVELIANATQSAGDIYEHSFNTIWGVTLQDCVATDAIQVATEGVFDLPKLNSTDTFAEGAKIYNETGKASTNISFTPVAICVAASANGDTTVRARLYQHL